MSEPASAFWFRRRTGISCIPEFSVVLGSTQDVSISNRMLAASNVQKAASNVGGFIDVFINKSVNVGFNKILAFGAFAGGGADRVYDDQWLTDWAKAITDAVPEIKTTNPNPKVLADLSVPLTDNAGQDLVQKYSHLRKIGGSGNTNPDFKVKVKDVSAESKITALGKGKHSGVRIRSSQLQNESLGQVGSIVPCMQLCLIQNVELEALANYPADLRLDVGISETAHYSIRMAGGGAVAVYFVDEASGVPDVLAIAALTDLSKLKILWHYDYCGSTFFQMSAFGRFGLYEVNAAGDYINRFAHPTVVAPPGQPFASHVERFHQWKNLGAADTTGSHTALFTDQRTLIYELNGVLRMDANPAAA